jgi:hypothetical protein
VSGKNKEGWEESRKEKSEAGMKKEKLFSDF